MSTMILRVRRLAISGLKNKIKQCPPFFQSRATFYSTLVIVNLFKKFPITEHKLIWKWRQIKNFWAKRSEDVARMGSLGRLRVTSPPPTARASSDDGMEGGHPPMTGLRAGILRCRRRGRGRGQREFPWQWVQKCCKNWCSISICLV